MSMLKSSRSVVIQKAAEYPAERFYDKNRNANKFQI
jgi:hypothetical protein